jgi:hypothetical protein
MNYKRLLFNWLAKKGILHLYKHNLLYYRNNTPSPPSYNEANISSAIVSGFLWLATPEPSGFWGKCHSEWVTFYENYKLKHYESKNKQRDVC